MISIALGGLFVLTVAETAVTHGGRGAFADGALFFATPAALALPVLVFLSGLLHIRDLRAGVASESHYPSRGVAGMHAGFLAFAGVFLVVHFVHTWASRSHGAAVLYDTLRADLGRPGLTALYVTGMTAAAFAFGIAVPVVAAGIGWAREPAPRRLARWGGAFAAFALWLILLNTVSHFVVGRAILWGA
jgi:hypothetical protein